jgi:hypothetical protein
VFGFVKRNLSEAERRKDAASGERGAGKGAAALVPASAHGDPEREALRIAVDQHYAFVENFGVAEEVISRNSNRHPEPPTPSSARRMNDAKNGDVTGL